ALSLGCACNSRLLAGLADALHMMPQGGCAAPHSNSLLATEWQLASAAEGVNGERRRATPNLDLPRSCVPELHAGASDEIVRYDEFAIVDLAKSLEAARC